VQYIEHIFHKTFQQFATKQNKALAKTLFHFFLRWVFEGGKKNESVFCAVAIEIQIIFLCGGGFLIIYFFTVACSFKAVCLSSVLP